jgi:hypothetical protein
MNLRDVQARLAAVHLYAGDIDGDPGPKSRAAIDAFLAQQGVVSVGWSSARRLIAAQQLVCKLDGIAAGAVDGLAGTQTKYAFGVFDIRKANGGKPVPVIENWRNDEAAPQAVPTRPLPATPITSSKVNAPSTMPVWPKQSGMDSFYGAKGTGQTSLVLPFAMRIAWDLSSKVTKVSCHKRVADSLERIWVRTLDHYTLPEIQRLGLDLFGGCLNVRKMRGGSAWSIHSWGCAWDVDPDHNQLNFHRAKATLDNPPFDPFWRFVYDEGAIGLGRERDYDWMHFQFARL